MQKEKIKVNISGKRDKQHNISFGYLMDTLKSHIYWLCDELRRLEAFGLSNSQKYFDVEKELAENVEKLKKAEDFLKKN